MKICDHKSVGVLVWKDEKLLLIERAKLPFGFAIPAGYVDGDDTFEKAATRELKEEVGLEITELKIYIEGRKENPCRREEGNWHYWKIYQGNVIGDIKPSLDETKHVGWYSKNEIQNLAERTEKYLAKGISEDEWQKNPGLEPVMVEWFKELNII